MKQVILVYALLLACLSCSNEGLAPRGGNAITTPKSPATIYSTTVCSVTGPQTIGCGAQSQNYTYSISGSNLGTVTWSLANVVPAGSVSLMVVSPSMARVTFGSTFSSCTINASGGDPYICQTYQNVVSNCGPQPCTLTFYPGFTSPTNSINKNGSAVNGYIAFYSNMEMVADQSDGLPHDYSIGTVNGDCRPTYTKSFTFTQGSRTWTVYISGQTGIISLKLMPGSPSVPIGQTVSFNYSYTLP